MCRYRYEEYVKIARKKGVEAHLIKDELPFNDKSFDTVIMFELAEHVQNPDKTLKEAKRVARKNILIAVPYCSGFEILRNYGLTYEHFLELDHVNFFTKRELEKLLSKHFRKFRVEEREPILLGKVGATRMAKKASLAVIQIEIHQNKYLLQTLWNS